MCLEGKFGGARAIHLSKSTLQARGDLRPVGRWPSSHVFKHLVP